MAYKLVVDNKHQNQKKPLRFMHTLNQQRGVYHEF